MPKQELTIKLTLEYDPEQNDGKQPNIFLYQFLTRLNNLWPILEIEYKGLKKDFRNEGSDISKIALRKVDSISDDDLPKKPEWLKDKTVLPREKK